ncbi:MAG: hypothetical protein WCS56_01275 [Bacilli bacterium]
MDKTQNKSLIEIAYDLFANQKVKKPLSLKRVTKEVIKKIKDREFIVDLDDDRTEKGIYADLSNEAKNCLISQFEMDFMLCGDFIYCGETEKNTKKDVRSIWDLKSREKSSLLDKDNEKIIDDFDEDEEVTKNELKDDLRYDDIASELNDDDADEDDDDIASDLQIIHNDKSDVTTSDDDDTMAKVVDDDDDDDDDDDIASELDEEHLKK